MSQAEAKKVHDLCR
jgi:hypothetical protein